MNVTCPSCLAEGLIDNSKLPPEGRSITCPKCATRFLIHTEIPERVPATTATPPEDRMTCPKCGLDQEKSESCHACGVIIEKFLRRSTRNIESFRKIEFDENTESSVTVAWFDDLFDRRHTMLLTRVLLLLLLIAVLVTCSFSISQRKTNRTVIEVVGSRQSAAQLNAANDERFKAEFDAIVSGMNANIDQCFRQCNNYLYSPWYLQGDDKPAWVSQRHVLTESMQQEYSDITAKKLKVKNMYSIPTPSPRYYDCYSKVRHLFSIYDTLYQYVENYQTYYYGFRETLSSLNAEHIKLQEELNVCRRSF